ncbi:MAG: hypothetical protein LBI58_07450 [Tannerellaceae bacterium]|jgi:hypothetical protein|nr:hypothetical protein [Tannerellaceae bacterium]
MRRKTKTTGDRQYSVDNPVNHALLLGLSFLILISGYGALAGSDAADVPSGATPLWEHIRLLIPGLPYACLAGCLVTVFGAVLLHRMNYMLMIIREKTIMPPLLYILLIGSSAGGFMLTPVLPALLSLMLASYILFTSFHEGADISKAFNIAFLIGLGSLLWTHLLLFMPLFWWGMYSFNILRLRTFLASLMGVGVIYWFMLGWCVVTEDFAPFTLSFSLLIEAGGQAEAVFYPPYIKWANLLLIAFFGIVGAGNIMLIGYDDNLRTRKCLSFLTGTLIFSVILFLAYGMKEEGFSAIACMPIALLTAHFLTSKKSKRKLWLCYVMLMLITLLTFLKSPWIYSLNTAI